MSAHKGHGSTLSTASAASTPPADLASARAAAAAGEAPQKSGFMVKLGQKRKTWKRRFFELRGSTLAYYTKQGGDMKGALDLTAGSVIPKTRLYAKKEMAFEISTPSRTMLVHCDNRDDLRAWSRAIQEAAWSASLQHATSVTTTITEPHAGGGIITVNDDDARGGGAAAETKARGSSDDGNNDDVAPPSNTGTGDVKEARPGGTDSEAAVNNKVPMFDGQGGSTDVDVAAAAADAPSSPDRRAADGSYIIANSAKEDDERDAALAAAALLKAEELHAHNSAKRVQRGYRQHLNARAKAAAKEAQRREAEANAKAEAEKRELEARQKEAETRRRAEAEEEARKQEEEALEKQAAAAAAAAAETKARVATMMEKLQVGAVFMKKRGEESEYRTPRFVWCEMGTGVPGGGNNSSASAAGGEQKGAAGGGSPRVCWSKGREKNASHFKSAPASDFSGVVSGMNQAAVDTSSAKGKGKGKKVKRTSVFAGLHDAGSARVHMITPDACFSLVHKSDGAHDVDLHLDKSAAQSRVPGAVAKRRDAWVDAFNCFLDRTKTPP
jgi:hypothetical protein